MHGTQSPNHDYVLATAIEIAPATASPPRILDFGCGTGTLIRKGREAGVDMWGADAYPRHWQGSDNPLVTPFVRRIENSLLPFDAAEFDVVVSNQVFEHVSEEHLDGCFNEIARVLKPGGAFLALFPTRDVWFEGHLGIYFPHRMAGRRGLQWRYLWLMHKLGFGYHRAALTSAQWADGQQHALDTDIFHHDIFEIERRLEACFGTSPHSLASHFMRYRIHRAFGSRRLALRLMSAVPNRLLSFVCHKRAGRVLLVRRSRGKVQSGPERLALGEGRNDAGWSGLSSNRSERHARQCS